MIEWLFVAAVAGGGYVIQKKVGAAVRKQARSNSRRRGARERGKGRTWRRQQDIAMATAALRRKLAKRTRERDQARGAAKESQSISEAAVKAQKAANAKIDQALVAIILLCNKQQRLIFSVKEIRALCNMVRGSSIGFTPWKGKRPPRY